MNLCISPLNIYVSIPLLTGIYTIHIYIYTYIHTHTHIYIYIDICVIILPLIVLRRTHFCPICCRFSRKIFAWSARCLALRLHPPDRFLRCSDPGAGRKTHRDCDGDGTETWMPSCGAFQVLPSLDGKYQMRTGALVQESSSCVAALNWPSYVKLAIETEKNRRYW